MPSHLFYYLLCLTTTVESFHLGHQASSTFDFERLFENHLLTYDPIDQSPPNYTVHQERTNEIILPVDPNLLIPTEPNQFESPPTSPPSLFAPQTADRRFMVFSPFKRLAMAYLAPRILRFQFSMILNTLLSELSRKILDPIISMRNNPRMTESIHSAPTPAPSASSSPQIVELLNVLSQLQPPPPTLPPPVKKARLSSTIAKQRPAKLKSVPNEGATDKQSFIDERAMLQLLSLIDPNAMKIAVGTKLGNSESSTTTSTTTTSSTTTDSSDKY